MTAARVKRFLFVSHHPTFGGPENQALRLSGPLASRGWQTLVALTDEPGNSADRLEQGGVPVVRLPLHRLRASPDPRLQAPTLTALLPEIRALGRLIRRHAIDVVLVPGLENPHAAIAARLTGRPVVWQLLGTRTPMAFRRAMAPLVRGLADAIMPTGPSLVAHHPGLGGLGERVVPFFPPVDTEAFAPDPGRRRAARNELGFAEDDIVVGNVANLNAQKDHVTFVRAAAELRRCRPDVRFLWLGETSTTQSAYEQRVWSEVAAAGLAVGTDLIHHRPGGRVTELAPALDVFWMTSEQRSEGVPTAMLEAMALEIPVVATRVGGVADVLRDGAGGCLVAPGDPGALARRTVALIADPEYRLDQGRRARAVIRSEAGMDRCVASHLRAFEVAEARRGRSSL